MIEDQGLRTEDWGPRIEDQWLRTKGWGPRIKDQGLRTEDWGPKTEDRGLRTKGWGPRIEEQILRTEDRGLRIEDWRPRIVGSGLRTAFYLLRLTWLSVFETPQKTEKIRLQVATQELSQLSTCTEVQTWGSDLSFRLEVQTRVLRDFNPGSLLLCYLGCSQSGCRLLSFNWGEAINTLSILTQPWDSALLNQTQIYIYFPKNINVWPQKKLHESWYWIL